MEEVKRLKFVLNGCDISFTAEAPDDITLKQLIKLCDRIKPDWCACGICSYEYVGYSDETEPDIVFTYDNVEKVDIAVPCSIKTEKISYERNNDVHNW